MTQHLETELVHNYSELQGIILSIMEDFLSSDRSEFDKKIDSALGKLGEFVCADRVYIFDYDFENYTCSNTYEWCKEGIIPVIDELQNVSLDGITYWVDLHKRGEVVYLPDVLALDEADGVRQILEPQGVLSLLAVPMMKNNRCYGFIGFDSVLSRHDYTDFERKALSDFSKALLFLLQNKEISDELEQMKSQLDSILDSQKEAILRIDRDTKILYSNQEFTKLSGLSKNEIIGRKIKDKFAPKYYKRVENYLNTFNSSVIHTEAFEIKDIRGDTRWLEWTIYPIMEKGGISKHQIVGRDITELKKYDQELKENNQRLNHIIEASKIGTWEIDFTTEKMEFNEIYAQMLGYTIEELSDVKAFNRDRYHPEDFESGVVKNIRAVYDGVDSYYSEHRMKHKNGSWVWVRDQGKVIERDDYGAPLKMYGTHIDISKIKKNEEEMKAILQAIEYSPAAVIITDKIGDILYINPKFTEITGYSADEALGKNPRILKSDYHDAQFYKEMWNLISSGREWKGRLRNRRKNGELYWESASISPVFSQKGEILNYVAIKEDITNIVQVEEIEANFHKLMQKFTKQVPGAVYQYQMDTDGKSRFPFSSEGIYEIYEVTPEEITEDASVVFTRIDPDYLQDILESIVKSHNDLSIWNKEYPVILPTLGKKWIRGTARPERLENGGTFWNGYLVDITEEKNMQESIRISEERLNLAIEGTGSGIWDWDMITGKVEYSTRWKSMLGYEDWEVSNDFNGWRNLWHPEDEEMIKAKVNEYLEGNSEDYEVIHRLKHKDGTYKWILTRGKTIFSAEGQVRRFIGTNTDITEQKRIQAELETARITAEEASLSKGRFLSNMSHEIRTPLNVILGNAYLMDKEDRFSTEEKTKIKGIISSGEHLLEMINEVLDMAKIESGSSEINLEEINLEKLIDRNLDILKSQAESKYLSFFVKKEIPRNLKVKADRLKLTQVMLNLGSNAVKYTSEGNVEIEVKTSKRNKKTMLTFVVNDTGQGITEEDKPHIFDQFFHRSYNNNVGGTGLGLPISKKYAELVGGNIEFDSEFGVGSTFTFTVELENMGEECGSLELDVLEMPNDSKFQRYDYYTEEKIHLPEDIVKHLKDAVNNGDIELLETLIESLSKNNKYASDILRGMMEDFDYDGINEIILRMIGDGKLNE